MGELQDKIKLSLKANGDGLVDNFKNNSLFFYERYQKSNDEIKNISASKMFPGGFYHLHYKDESNWMRYAPIFLADFKKFSNKIIILAVNLNFIPIEVRGLLFDKFISKEMIEKNSYLKVDYEGMYNELRKIGFEYALMEFDSSRVEYAHKIHLDILPRFLYAQHPINKYDPAKLMQIWEAKINKRDARHKEIILSTLDEFYDTSKEISEKYDVLKNHIKRVRRNIEKFK